MSGDAVVRLPDAGEALTTPATPHRLGITWDKAGGVPSAAFTSGDRVMAVVRDDVEAMVAMHDV